MGLYLSHLRNQKADPRTGRVPDENYAREVMQLFSIGLVELNADGSPRSVAGKPVETYGAGRHRRPGQGVHRLELGLPGLAGQQLLLRRLGQRQLRPRPQLQAACSATRSTTAKEEKSFLGTTIAAQTTADPQASLNTALDTLAAHPNVGPFIGRQLIQRLVTSNPSPAYVARRRCGLQRRQACAAT